MKRFNLKQLHFHLKNNDSFLRMHKPNKFGDNLTDIRPTIAYVNKNKTKIDSFEEGRIYNGYRFVFPIAKDNIHLSSVEVSFAAKAFTRAIMEDYTVYSNFLVSKDVVNEKVFNSEKSNYKNSKYDDFYLDKGTEKVIEWLKKNGLNLPIPSPEIYKTANKNIKEGESFALYSKNRKHILIYIPIKNKITNKVVASLSISTKDTYIENKSLNSKVINIVTILFIFFTLLFIYIQRINKDKIIKSKDYLHSILDSQPSFIVVTDGKNLIKLNKFALDFFGYKTVESFYKEHKCICDFFVEDRHYITKEVDGILWIDYILANPNKNNQVKIKDTLGNIHIFQVKCNNIKSLKNNYVVTFIDITVVEQNSKVLYETNRQLEESEYEIQLINESLEEKIKKAVDDLDTQHQKHKQDIVKNTKFNIIGQMAAGITHEINTPLTYIKGTTEMSRYDLEDMPDNSFKQRLLEDNDKVMNGIKRMGIIIESMREMSQVTPALRENQNIYSTLITVLIIIYNRSKQISKIYLNNELFELERSLKDKYKFIASVHKQRIEQVWTIILNNALDELIKIDNFENRRIDITIEEIDDKIRVIFKDNAGGIPESIKDKLFEPFVSTKESSGIGIGLNVAKKIIDEHDSTIIASNYNDGACFTIELPISNDK
ncbi:MAG: ATP-binding protein [Campylobacterota bacterium]|nr:ATP-binding protein [Campylobacterota bacterium]